jgi:hypothetical protein
MDWQPYRKERKKNYFCKVYPFGERRMIRRLGSCHYEGYAMHGKAV